MPKFYVIELRILCLFYCRKSAAFYPYKEYWWKYFASAWTSTILCKKGKDKMCIKIDLQKAYDMVNWEFVCHMLRYMGFPQSIIDIMQIITYFFNDGWWSPIWFHWINYRSTTRRSPISLSLCFAIEYFYLIIEEDDDKGRLKPISTIQPTITHLLYADDVMIFLL